MDEGKLSSPSACSAIKGQPTLQVKIRLGRITNPLIWARFLSHTGKYIASGYVITDRSKSNRQKMQNVSKLLNFIYISPLSPTCSISRLSHSSWFVTPTRNISYRVQYIYLILVFHFRPVQSRASRFPGLWVFIYRRLVELLWWEIDPWPGLYLHNTTQTEIKRRHMSIRLHTLLLAPHPPCWNCIRQSTHTRLATANGGR